MSSLDINPNRELSGYLVTTKQLNSRSSLETPIRSRPLGLFEDVEILDVAYGVGEAHIEISSQDLDDLSEPPNNNFEEWVADRKATHRNDEIGVVIIEYTGQGIVNIPGMEELARILSENFDVIISPLMSRQIDSVDLDENPEPYNRFVENTERFLGAFQTLDCEPAVLGTLPIISWESLEELLDLHLENEVTGWCVDFLGKKPTARHRVSRCISPLIERLGKERNLRTSILYAVNAYRGQNRTDGPRSPAEDFFVFGLGFDVLGGSYYSPGAGWSPNEKKQFRCFYPDTYEQEYVALESLPDELPERTAFDQQFLLNMAQDDDQRSRVQLLLEVEQMNIAYEELKAAINDGQTADFLTDKTGTVERIENRMEAIQDAYDDGRSSPALSSF